VKRLEKNFCLFLPIGAWPVVICMKQTHKKLVNSIVGSYELLLAYVGFITRLSSFSNIKK